VEHIDLLEKALSASGMHLTPLMINQFTAYHRMILEWNRKINLISRDDENRIISRHFLESLGVLQFIEMRKGEKAMDLGSGAGFPGIPLKIFRPDLEMTLVESRRKKAVFLMQVKETLPLQDTKVIARRAEEIEAGDTPFDTVMCRAVADLSTLVLWCSTLVRRPGGRLIAIKGTRIDTEIDRMKKRRDRAGIEKWSLMDYLPFPSFLRGGAGKLILVEWGP